MKWTIGRWTTTLTAAALIALPAAGFAQTTPPTTPPQTSPPAATQPPPEQPTPQTGSSAQEAARVHLTAARNTLSQLTQLPAASSLQGETRAQVAELITNFNELITTQANWKDAFEKVEANLASLLNSAPASAPTAAATDPSRTDPSRPNPPQGAVGTTGTTTTSLDPGIRSKLVEFRSHLDKFEEAAGGAKSTSTTSTTTTTTTTQTEPPPSTPTNPPAQATPPTSQPPTQTPPTNQTPPPTQTPPTAPTNPAKPDEPAPIDDDKKEGLLNHIDAIEAILSAQAIAQTTAQTATGGAVGTSGTASGSTRTTVTGNEVRLTPAQVEQLRTHLAELRRLVGK
jgi:hypothetical protein